jgi:pimeloyl-ACP methyl ester carboxylesterase
MDDQNNLPDAQADAQAQPYQHDVMTNVTPMQRDHLGRPFWESYQSPAGYQVRAEARVPPHMPGIVIFVHGVNSEGEWYDAAEKALCEGLNTRLGRNDHAMLKENVYITRDPKTKEPINRKLDPDSLGSSPVIRFYWGYRSDYEDLKRWTVPLRNLKDDNEWAPVCSKDGGPWYWGGGAFQNGTNNLQQLWSEKGFSRYIYGFDMQHLNTEVDRQLQDAPPRIYYSHAAQRLAKLIDKIRAKNPRDTITLMSHSQGTMIAMAATLLCKERAPDAVFVMNSPFALDDKMTDSLTCGGERPTAEARVNTFKAVANRIKQDKQVYNEEMMQQLHVGASQDMNFWRPDLKMNYGVPERDNHGRLYVYFTPHDRVMGAAPLQSIGWQGVNNKLLDELGDTVKQRMLARSMPVGDEPGIRKFGSLPRIAEDQLVPGAKPTDFWNGNRRVAGAAFGLPFLWAVPNGNQTVTVNAEKVPNPLTAEEMAPFEKSRKYAPEYGQFNVDPKNPNQGSYEDPTFPYHASIYQPENYVTRDDVYSNSGQKRTLESGEELIDRITNYKPEPTNHSTLPSNPEFMKRVASWDLPIGFCDSFEDREFWFDLIKAAEWTSGHDTYFDYGTFDEVGKPATIDWTTVAEETSIAEAKRIQYGEKYRGS